MKIAILQGTPRSKETASETYISFITKNFPTNQYNTIPIGTMIHRLESDESYFNTTMKQIGESNGILWIVPVYYALVPSQVKRFIELVFQRHAERYFENKYTACITTSINFFDHTAMNYIRATCEDFLMHYVDDFSATIFPVINEDYKKNLTAFIQNFSHAVKHRPPTSNEYFPIHKNHFLYTNEGVRETQKTESTRVTLVTDATENDTNISRMIETFIKVIPCNVSIVDLNKLNMTGCRGCLQCSYDNRCTLNDDFYNMFETQVKMADAVVWAGKIKDRFLSSQWKMFFDRSFYNNHIDVLNGKQIGVIISGNLRENGNIREVLNGIIEVHNANRAGYVSDEYSDPNHITSLLDDMAQRLIYNSKQQYKKPETFLGVGAHKLIRDFVYITRYPLRADFNYYKKNIFQSFPQKRYKDVLRTSLFLLIAKFTKDKNKLLKMYRSKANNALRKALGM